MKLKTIPYKDYETNLPQEGRHILSQQEGDYLYVYQAFNPNIAKYAVENQKFGGDHYSFTRMTWIKPNFLWMMYRSGWAQKKAQTRILAIKMLQSNFEKILEHAIFSSYQPELYSNREEWQALLPDSEVRLQWDPDHDPLGEKLTRKAIQLGLRGETLHTFNNEMITEIVDLTPFVLEQFEILESKGPEHIQVIEESVIEISSPKAMHSVQLDLVSS